MPKFTDSVDATSYTKWSNVDKSICEANEGYFCLPWAGRIKNLTEVSNSSASTNETWLEMF